MFKSKNEGNIVYKCTVRLLDVLDCDVLECEFQVIPPLGTPISSIPFPLTTFLLNSHWKFPIKNVPENFPPPPSQLRHLPKTQEAFSKFCFLPALFQPNHKGKFLLDYVCEQLDITEKDYFGLRYVDSTKQRVSWGFFVFSEFSL